MFSSFSTRPCPCLCFLTVSIRSLYSNSVASGKGSKNSHLDKISGGGTPETRFVSRFSLLFFVTSGSLTRGPPSIAEGDAPGITSRVKGNDLAGCKQNSIHWWTNGDGPRARPPSASASLPESGIAGIAFGKKNSDASLVSVQICYMVLRSRMFTHRSAHKVAPDLGTITVTLDIRLATGITSLLQPTVTQTSPTLKAFK